MSKQYLRKSAVAMRYGFCKRTIDRMVQLGRLPAPIYLGNCPIWDRDLLDQFDARLAAEAQPEAKAKAAAA